MSAAADRHQAVLLRSAAVALADHRLDRAAAHGLGRRVLVQRLRGRDRGWSPSASAILLYMLFGWFGTVIGESEGRLYNKKVDLSFRWGDELVHLLRGDVLRRVLRRALLHPQPVGARPRQHRRRSSSGPTTPRSGPPTARTTRAQFTPMGAMGIPLHQHDHPADVGRHADDRAPRAQGGPPRARSSCGCSSRSCSGFLFVGLQAYEYIHAYTRAEPQAVDRRLRLDVLHADRLPRPARDDRRHHAARDARSACSRATSPPTTTSPSRRRRGTGTSSTWSGCCCSCSSTGWSERARGKRKAARSRRAAFSSGRRYLMPPGPIQPM